MPRWSALMNCRYRIGGQHRELRGRRLLLLVLLQRERLLRLRLACLGRPVSASVVTYGPNQHRPASGSAASRRPPRGVSCGLRGRTRDHYRMLVNRLALRPTGWGRCSPASPTALAARGATVQIRSCWTNVFDRSSAHHTVRRWTATQTATSQIRGSWQIAELGSEGPGE